jgi:phosphoribosyl 1,2-cyclic phosphodiesterase
MARLGLSIQKVKAVFISHEHTDHTRGLPTLVKKYRLPAYITKATHCNCGFVIGQEFVMPFCADEPVNIGTLTIKAFSKLHDASDPYSFMVGCKGVNVGVFTDIGKPCTNVTSHFAQCHAAFLEANYDVDMLETGNYPYHLKRRIRGGKGHLSNKEALELFKKHKPAFMSHLVLSHLSKNNNCPQLVEQLFSQNTTGVKTVVASRYEETPVFHISGNSNTTYRKNIYTAPQQLAFSFL